MDTLNESLLNARDETDEAFQARFAEACRLGAARLQAEPLARKITYDPEARRFTVALTNGTTIGFAAEAVVELAGANPAQLADCRLMGCGDGLEWTALDLHMSLEGLLLDLLSGEAWQQRIRAEFNRRLARSGSEARTKASRENGKKGGRPRKRTA